MENITIDGRRILDIYGSTDGKYWFVTEKIQKHGQTVFSGYIRTSQPPVRVRFYYIPEGRFNWEDKMFWKIHKNKWSRCPGIEIENDGTQTCDEAAAKTGMSYQFQECSNNDKEVDEKMDIKIKDKLHAYLEIFDEILEKTDSESTAIVLLQEISKDLRMEKIKEGQNAKNEDQPATDKQKKFMKKLGLDFPKNITKKEASVMIDEELSKNGSGE